MPNFQPHTPEQVDDTLAPYAVKHSAGDGRIEKKEKTPSGRFRFQVDSDRIAHSTAFHRLEKTQVYSHDAVTDGPISKRWSHTLEVMRLARAVARQLGLNEDMVEAVAMGHDLGHAPFAHEGDEALDEWMQTHGLRFEHNYQSYVILRWLERRIRGMRGLNLNRETYHALLSHVPRHGDRYEQDHSPFVEAQVVDVCDSICYTARDIHDGIHHVGVLQAKKLRDFALFGEAEQRAFTCERRDVRSVMIDILARNVVKQTFPGLQGMSLADVKEASQPLVVLSPKRQQQFAELGEYLFAEMYRPPGKKHYVEAVRSIIFALCEANLKEPAGDVLLYQKIAEERDADKPNVVAVADYVASLTDSKALSEAKQLGVSKKIRRRARSIFRT